MLGSNVAHGTMTAAKASPSRRHALLFFTLGQIAALALSNVVRSSSKGGPWTYLRSQQTGDAHPSPSGQPPRRLQTRVVDRSQLPQKCGLIFFFHVPSTGGATINTWLRQYADNETTPYFTLWGRDKKMKKNSLGVHEGMEEKFIHGNPRHTGMNNFAKDIGPEEWRIAHCHHSSMHLNATEEHLSQWRASVESQGCAFVAAVMFREPLSHTMSLYKHIKRFDSSRDVWTRHLQTPSETGFWQTQLDYFLYNFIARNPHQVDKDAKVQRALEILTKHFDIVTVGEHDRFKRELLERTGWEDQEMRRTNTHNKDIVFTKKEVEALQKLMEENGDVEFIYEVKKLFGSR